MTKNLPANVVQRRQPPFTWWCLNSKFDKKVENLAYVSSEIKTRCKNINEEIDRLNTRLHRWAKNLKSISEYIKNEMIATGKKKVDTELYTVSLRKSEVCETDPEFIEEAKTQNLRQRGMKVVPPGAEQYFWSDSTKIQKEYFRISRGFLCCMTKNSEGILSYFKGVFVLYD